MTDTPTRAAGRPPAAKLSSRRRLSEDVAEQITAYLIEERLKPGDRLPTEPELVELYDVSRTVVREAGRLLVERGLVDIRPGRGMVVAPFDGTSISRQWQLMLVREQGTFAHLMEMRLALEVGMTELAAERRTDLDIDAITRSVEDFLVAGDNHLKALEADLDFHASVAVAAHNPFFLHVINPINTYLRQVYRPSLGYEEARAQTLAEHRAIAEAIAAGDVQGAGAAARAHLERIGRDAEELVADSEGEHQ